MSRKPDLGAQRLPDIDWHTCLNAEAAQALGALLIMSHDSARMLTNAIEHSPALTSLQDSVLHQRARDLTDIVNVYLGRLRP